MTTDVIRVISEEWDLQERAIEAHAKTHEPIRNRLDGIKHGRSVDLEALHRDLKLAELGELSSSVSK